ncbi:PDZ domain-containing protein [Sphingomonas sp.]|uniref:S41 family peptidase n=1 Tax=Sphingomonas sp. TaxID=28214 RepID=UPI00286D90B0|nr:PDZ domain-containing protein [Sphingomonas sp.]
MTMLDRLAVVPLAAMLLAADQPAPADFAADARSIETLVNANYAYLERFPGGRMPITAKLRAEADTVASGRELVRYSERALALLADHHAITGASTKDSRAVFPSYGDLWVEPRGRGFVIEAVRADSPAAQAGITRGDHLLAIDGVPTAAAVAAFWADLGATGGGARDGFAARVLAAGRRDRPRILTVGNPLSRPRDLSLPNLYMQPRADRPEVAASTVGRNLVIKFNDSLGSDATIPAFDAAMATARPGQPVILDLTDTPSGGNTTIARAILGWFVAKPSFYQVHTLPAEERRTGIARQWVEQVLPRIGKRHRGPVTVRVGRWTGSMGEGLAIGFDAIGARVEGDRMAGLLGAIYDHKLEKSGQIIKFPTERLSAVDGTPRERFVPRPIGSR